MSFRRTQNGAASLVVAIAVSFLLIKAGPASANGSPTPAPRYQESGWTFLPDFSVQESKVSSILGWADASIMTGQNLGVLWFVPMGNGSWMTLSWGNSEIGAAVKSIRSIPGFETAFEGEADIDVAVSLSTTEPTDPKVVENGLFLDDPLQGIVSTISDPAAFVSMMAAIGWQATPGLGWLNSPEIPLCNIVLTPTDEFIAFVAIRAETSKYGQSSTANPCPVAWTWPCSGCTYTITNPVPVPGAPISVQSIPLTGGMTKCIYRQNATATKTGSGDTRLLCNTCSCANGCQVQGHLACIDDVLPGQSCPPTPPSTCNWVFIP